MQQKTIGEIYDFTGKTVVVTGASMGIGFGIVKRFVEAGANVAIADISKVGQQKADEINANGGNAIFIKTDVSNEDDVKNLIAKVVEKFGTIDVFVNNAGIFPFKSVMEMDTELWDKVQAINGRGVFLCSREAAKIMIPKKEGTIINIASVDALHPSMVGLAAYDNSKHGVWGFTKNFALEIAQYNIRVNAIAPGGVQTEGVAAMSGDVSQVDVESVAADVPMGRMAKPDEMAKVALFLASDAASYMTGSLVVVDGGMLLK